MKHNFVNKYNRKFTIIDDKNPYYYSNNSKLIDTDKCIYCNLTGENIVLCRELFYSIYDHFEFLNEKFPCISDDEYVIKKLLE